MQIIPSTGINFGFTGQDVLNNAALIVSGLSSFVILTLAVSFAPKLIEVIHSVFDHDIPLEEEEEEE